MFTTRRLDGSLVSRPMATQKYADFTGDATGAADLWFVTDIYSHKMEELGADPHVSITYPASQL